ncbi:MAG: hypothetical protein H6732_14845 [Alphaproteobacteria bacterium]|nr:hypothetical protein [Alphaproteobacteria bacterium]
MDRALPPSKPAPALRMLLATALAVVAAVALRMVAWAAIRLILWTYGLAHDADPWITWWVAGYLAGGALLGGGALFVHRRVGLARDDRAVQAGWVVAALLLAGAAAVHLDQETRHGMLSQGFVGPPEVGRFPFEPGASWVVERGPYLGKVQVDTEGMRRCTPDGLPDSAGRVRTFLVGDSFVFGQALDDEETLCWQLRERLQASDPGLLSLHNVGQPGASLHSYARTLDWLTRTREVDLALVAVLAPNDGQVLEVNTHRRMLDDPIVRLISAVLTPQDAFDLAVGFVKAWRAELFDWFSMRQALEEIVAIAAREDLPTVIWVWGRPDGGDQSWYTPYVDLARELASDTPQVRVVGVLGDPLPDEGEPWRIPGDGHPTPRAVRSYVDRLAPIVAETARQVTP